MDSEQIQEYYDRCHKDFKRVWQIDRCMALHYGFWDNGTKKLSDALINENKKLAEQVEITFRDRVLDAGCGVGGSAIFLAEHYGCNVTGITHGSRQVEHAIKYAEINGVEERTTFIVADYTNVPFPDGSFDVIWAVESVCHAEKKKDFLKEAYRLLRKGGRLIIADGFQSKNKLTGREAALLKRHLNGWGTSSLDTDAVFHAHLIKMNYRDIKTQDVTSLIYRSSKILFILAFPALFVHLLETILGKRGLVELRSLASTLLQFINLKKGLWKYMIFQAEK